MNDKILNLNSATKKTRENSFGWTLKTISTELDNEMTLALKPYQLDLGKFSILMTLFENDGLSQSDIGKQVSMPGYATTRNIDKLEALGLLKRHDDKNSRRCFCIRLTEKGTALAPDLFLIVSTINERFLSPLRTEEIQVFESLLKKIVKTRGGV